ncbi:6-phosphogluconolactonase [Aeromicrobium sp. Leaf350]|uniref:6-phosphogluconolactonase n=1 Tax=Aeromicrobium sp. Leaf350 TaxID=2876565 RepID=UPI001E2F2378|nr:6-phosphogluconolactonase [Aeromicrobium sp. Leaf350]
MSSAAVVDDAAATLAQALETRLALLQTGGVVPRVALTGGTIANDAYRLLGANPDVDWTRVDLWWGDERFVPEGHADRNDQQAREAFLDRLEVPDERIHAAPAHGCDLSLAEAADAYAATLPDAFDVVLLGVGPDGHVASLFPGFEQLDEVERRAVEVFGSPKPPAERISLTFPTLNAADAVWFVASGDGKAEAIARALAPEGSVHETPARGVRGRAETAWIVDAAAASRIPTDQL